MTHVNAAGDALRDEWSVVVVAPPSPPRWWPSTGDRGRDGERRFDFAVTYDRDLVSTAASTLMRRVQPLD